MSRYAVIGLYPEDDQTTLDIVSARNPKEAMRKVATDRLGEFDKENDYYENQGIFELVSCVEISEPTKDDIINFPGEGPVEARDYIQPGWEFKKETPKSGKSKGPDIFGALGDIFAPTTKHKGESNE